MLKYEKEILKFKNTLIEQEKANNTVEKYLRDIKDYMIRYENNFILDNEKYHKNIIIDEEFQEHIFDGSILVKYKKYLKEKYNKVNTINSKISSINAYLDFLNKKDLKIKNIKCQKNMFSDVKIKLTKNDLQKLLDNAYKKKNKKIYYLMLTIARTGIRVSEVKYITVDSIKEGKALVDNKGKVRIVIIPKKLCKLLNDYCKNNNIKYGSIFITRNGNPMDRKNIWKEMKSLCEKADVEKNKVFPHNLRHLFAKEFYKQTKDIVKLASILGHSSIETTRIYTLQNEDEIILEIEKMNVCEILYKNDF